jgi:hypothetical protein
MRDLHHNIKAVRCISPVAVGTTGTGKTGKPVDRSGYDAVEVVLDYGTITATNATLVPTIFEGDATGTMTSVADANLLGTEALAGVAAAATRTSGTSKNVTKRIGYIGTKKYVNAKIVSTITAAPPVAATVILGSAQSRPVAT